MTVPLKLFRTWDPIGILRKNAHRIIDDGCAKGANGPRSILINDIIATFTASQHESADALVKPHEDIENIVAETLKGRRFRPSLGENERDYAEDEIHTEVKSLNLAIVICRGAGSVSTCTAGNVWIAIARDTRPVQCKCGAQTPMEQIG